MFHLFSFDYTQLLQEQQLLGKEQLSEHKLSLPRRTRMSFWPKKLTKDAIQEKNTARKRLNLTVPEKGSKQKEEIKSSRPVSAQTNQQNKQMKCNKNKKQPAKIMENLKKNEQRRPQKSKITNNLTSQM